MKAYFFVNCYLSQIQRGIQPAHVVGEMALKYGTPALDNHLQMAEMFETWLREHKTMVVLNGGPQDRLQYVAGLAENSTYQLPWAYFVESEDALNGALTCVGLIADPTTVERVDNIRAEKANLNVLDDQPDYQALLMMLAKGKTA